MHPRIVLLVLALSALAGLLPLAAQAKTPSLGSVRYIHRGLTVQAPRHKATRGRTRQKLYSAYQLSTKASQLASLGFRDGSTLHMNQRTALILRSSHATYVQHGEVDVIDNGAQHQVVTAAAVASAVGTQYDVRVILGAHGAVTVIVTVVQGTVIIKTAHGSVQVSAGQQVTVEPGGAVSPPKTVDAAEVVAWTAQLPPPPASGPTATPTRTSTPQPTATPIPSSTPTPSPPTSIAVLNATPITASFLAPPIPLSSPICGEPGWSQFSVSASGLAASQTYNLAITGSAGGVTLNTPVGSVTADQSGDVSGQTFTLPQIPGRHSWTLTATSANGGSTATTSLATDVRECVLPSVEDQNRVFTVTWAGAGWKPGTAVKLIVTVNGQTTDSATVGPDGSVPSRTVSIQCVVGFTPKYVVQGVTIDNPSYSRSLPDSLPCV